MARILVVDDEPDILLMLRMSLKGAGHDTVMAADGEMALERLEEHAPDMVLLDVMMPVMDGWGVLEAMRRRADATPVIVISANAGPRDAHRALELGAVEYITKPFGMEAMIATIERHLARSPEEREAHRLAALRAHGG